MTVTMQCNNENNKNQGRNIIIMNAPLHESIHKPTLKEIPASPPKLRPAEPPAAALRSRNILASPKRHAALLTLQHRLACRVSRVPRTSCSAGIPCSRYPLHARLFLVQKRVWRHWRGDFVNFRVRWRTQTNWDAPHIASQTSPPASSRAAS